nr:ribosomal protein S11 [Synarthrophyton patena]
MDLFKKKSNILLILFTKNNMICTLTTLKGKVLGWVTVGSLKSRGKRKVTSYSILSIAKILYSYNLKFGYSQVHIKIKGISKNQNLLIRYLKLVGFIIISFQQNSILPHNGCKVSRNRRI